MLLNYFPLFPAEFDIEQNFPLFVTACLVVASLMLFMVGLLTRDTLYKRFGMFGVCALLIAGLFFAKSSKANTTSVALLTTALIVIGVIIIYMVTPRNINGRRIAW